MSKDSIKPEVFITSFDDKQVIDYINQLNNIQDVLGTQQPILLHISSHGGSAYGLIMLYEHLISMGNPIVTYTTSKAISAGAFLLAMAGNPGMRYASPNATILVHEMQSATDGDMKEMEQQMSSIKALNDTILTIFAKSIGLKTAKDVRTLIRNKSVGHDLSLNAYEAKTLKIVDHVAYLKVAPLVTYNILQINPEEPTKKKSSKKT